MSPASAAATRVVLAEQDLLAREGMLRIFEATGGVELAAVCRRLDEVLATVDEHLPDVLVTGLGHASMADHDTFAIANELRSRHPQVGVLVLARSADPGQAMALFAHGSAGRGYLVKEALTDSAQLLAAVRAVAVGGSVVDTTVVEALLTPEAKVARAQVRRLTPRERDVLAAIASGRSNAAIADALGITKRAVEHHVAAIFLKLDLAKEGEISRRVAATRVFLAANEDDEEPSRR
jgi:DNA-binding NarL/FixJ family response regulator